MQQTDQALPVRSFIVTVWQELPADAETPTGWRFRLEDPHTHYTRVFAHPLGLIAALKEGALDNKPERIEQQRP